MRPHLLLLALFLASACTAELKEENNNLERRMRALQTELEASENARRYAAECDDGVASSCYALSLVYYFGDENAQGVPKDVDRAATLRDLACSRGHAPACAGPPEPMPAAR